MRSGGIERRRFENILWQRFSSFIYWGVTKYNLPKDEIRLAYDDAICSVITNIVTGKYQPDAGALLKTYAETIFHHKCIDHIGRSRKTAGSKATEKQNLKHPQPIQDSLADMLPDDVKNVVEEIIEREEHSKMRKCLEKVGDVCKEILRLYAGSYKDREIAVMMRYNSADVVKQTRYRCMEKLSEYYLNLYKYE
ncbi:sigma-70 family RNA polymerase sigma factor [Paraflavisolibacter sp. H34]|uniref:RNA polymerase sigma factor n=1 Tax=Huijunlia imazamoxiresistens TaxID=3127457 RepID=UPI003018CC14